MSKQPNDSWSDKKQSDKNSPQYQETPSTREEQPKKTDPRKNALPS